MTQAATAALRRVLSETEVPALTSVLEDTSVVGAVRAGAIGYLLKEETSGEVVWAGELTSFASAISPQ